MIYQRYNLQLAALHPVTRLIPITPPPGLLLARLIHDAHYASPVTAVTVIFGDKILEGLIRKYLSRFILFIY